MSMYSNKLAVAIKASGKVLRERGDSVFLPFGTEFSIQIKNLNTVRCLVSVYIDGTNATEGIQLIVQPNDDVELERYIRNANMHSGNRFKFIERSAAIESGPRGIKVDDGLVRIEYEFEKINQLAYIHNNNYFVGQNVNQLARGCSPYTLNTNILPQSYASSDASVAGITVPGSVSNQAFSVGQSFPTDGIKNSIVMRLVGETTNGAPINQPITVKAKSVCTTCGHHNPPFSKFCSECGTSLVLI